MSGTQITVIPYRMLLRTHVTVFQVRTLVIINTGVSGGPRRGRRHEKRRGRRMRETRAREEEKSVTYQHHPSRLIMQRKEIWFQILAGDADRSKDKRTEEQAGVKGAGQVNWRITGVDDKKIDTQVGYTCTHTWRNMVLDRFSNKGRNRRVMNR